MEKGQAALQTLGLLEPGARVAVVGLGKTGLSAARFLFRQGIGCAVVDSREKPPGLAELRSEMPGMAVFLGGFHSTALNVATHLLVSPGVALEEPAIRAALRGGARLLSDIDLFACMAQASVVGITGANGKSTVTTLLGEMARAAGRKAGVGGNLGTPALDLLSEDADLYVLELSSFQLERTTQLQCAAATVLNVSPDHLDRYPDIEAYADAKRRIFRGEGVMVLNADDPLVVGMAEPERRCVTFGLGDAPLPDFHLLQREDGDWLARKGVPLLPAAELRLQGRHNLANALAALALGEAVDLPFEAMLTALRTFRGLEHRMQWVADTGGIAWIDDSKATNIGACQAALEGLSGKAVLIAGGDGKGADFSPLVPAVARRARAAVLMGRDAPLLEQALHGVTQTVRVANMREAVQAARELAQPGDTVLLSPACASWDQYEDYRHRGRTFAEEVGRLKA